MFELLYIGDNVMKKTQITPCVNDLAYIYDNEQGYDNIYCLILSINIDTGKYKVLTEVGTILEEVNCM